MASQTVTQTQAGNYVDGIKLSKEDLATLPHQVSFNSAGWRMKLYSAASIEELAREKAARLGITLRQGASHDGYVTIEPSPFVPEKNPRHSPKPSVLKIEYTPPEPINPEDPLPESIIWKGEVLHENIGLEDACLLYLVRYLDSMLCACLMVATTA